MQVKGAPPNLALSKAVQAHPPNMTDPIAALHYVVLRHTGHGEAHFDLMIEPTAGADTLLTWRADQWPLADGTRLTPLGEHRRVYLTYEGPVSGGRGEVRRVAEGRCRLEWQDEWVVWFDQSSKGWFLGDTARRCDIGA
jgi:hypothetical protein